MATKNQKTVQAFVKGQLEEAQKRFTVLETEAEKVLKNLVARGKESRKELEGLVGRFNAAELATLGKKAEKAGSEVLEKIGQIQNRVIAVTGVASQDQLREVNRELGKLSKKIDSLLGGKKPAGKTEPRA